MYTSNIHVEVVLGFHRNCIKKIHRSNDEFSSIKIRLKKVNYVEFSPMEIMSKKVRRNHVDFSPIEIRSNKVHGNNVNFHPQKLCRRKYIETISIFLPSK